MLFKTWACFRLSPEGPAMMTPEVGKALQVTACEMYLSEREKFREFHRGACSGVVTTEWNYHFIGPRAKGVVFNASVVEIRVQYEANFFLELPELDRAKQFLQELEALDTPWQKGSADLPTDIEEALAAFSGSRSMN